jgi:rhomboid protease GluP
LSLRRSPVTALILAAIVIVFAVEFYIDRAAVGSVYLLGGLTEETLPNREYWRLVAAMFLHHGLLHFVVNVWALYQLGSLFELLFGSTRFAVTYFVSGIVASIVSAIFVAPATVAAGASGAIFGILGAFIFAIRRSPRWRHERWAKSLVTQLIGWGVLNIFIGLQFPGIDNSAHIGGLVAGLLLGLWPHRVAPPPPGETMLEASYYAESLDATQHDPQVGRRE